MEPLARSRTRRLKLSCAAYSLRQYLDLKDPRLSLEDFIVKVAEWGADAAELTEYYFKKPVTPEYVLRLKRLAFAWGLDVSGTPIGNNFALPPGPARDLGSPAIRIFAGGAPAGVDEAQARQWVVESIEACCEQAQKRGVFLALENHGGVVATADGLLDIVKAVRCEWFGVNLDTGNFHTADPYGDLARCAPYAVTCQVKTEIAPAGRKKETADLARIVSLLHQANYRGYVTLEHEADEEPMEAVPRHLSALRQLLG
jgi:sugar phosphate isomerase/epimerase